MSRVSLSAGLRWGQDCTLSKFAGDTVTGAPGKKGSAFQHEPWERSSSSMPPQFSPEVRGAKEAENLVALSIVGI